ncbi:hypothetical protein Tco_0993912 [Tanacetum coccineum]
MAESSNPTQIPPQQEQNSQQEQQPESPILFEPAPQVRFDIKDIIFNPNNEVALLRPPHTNSKYFKVRIYQKSQENRQKRANTDTRNGRAKEARDAKPKAGKVKKSKLWSTLGQFSVNKSQP